MNESVRTDLGKLTNLDISNDYRDVEMFLMRKDFTGPFANWVTRQSPYHVPIFLQAAVEFDAYVLSMMEGEEVKKFSYDDVSDMIAENVFEKIPAVLALNMPKVTTGYGYLNRHEKPHPDYDFIDLGALARNIFYDIIRHHINWAD